MQVMVVLLILSCRSSSCAAHSSWQGAQLCSRLLQVDKAVGNSKGLLRWLKHQNRRLTGKMLGIGDGANDVAMIQAADVGIGIMGKEGRQASLGVLSFTVEAAHLAAEGCCNIPATPASCLTLLPTHRLAAMAPPLPLMPQQVSPWAPKEQHVVLV